MQEGALFLCMGLMANPATQALWFVYPNHQRPLPPACPATNGTQCERNNCR